MNTLSHIACSTFATLLLVGCGSDGTTTVVDQKDTTKPVFTSNTIKTVTEGNKDIFTVMAIDKNNISYNIIGGEDRTKFQINAQSGVLAFITKPDFENPIDSDANNIYKLIVTAEDSEGNLQTQAITVTVTNDTSDDGPQFTSDDSVQIKENLQLDFTVEATGAVKYAMSGEDQKRFEFNTSTGKLKFLNFIPDFESSSDANHDNNYKIDILANDSNDFNSTQALTIQILNDDSDDTADANRVTIYKTGQDDGIVSGETFGSDRNFTQESIGEDRVIHVGKRTWQDSEENIITNYSFSEAGNYCSILNYANQDDWRVPNRHEMYEIVNYGNTYSDKPTIDDIFQNSTKANYWTSDNVLGHDGQVITNQAFAVYFTNGASYPLDRGQKFAVRCVKGDKLIYDTTITRDGDDIYRDTKTGFQWAKPADPQSMYDAKQRCENLVFENYDDWRLPNINELHTIMPSTIEDSYYPYGAKPLLDGGATQLWSSTKIDETGGRYLDNYWNLGVWGDNYSIPVDADHPLGRDVFNDATLPLDNAVSVFSICIRGGHL